MDTVVSKNNIHSTQGLGFMVQVFSMWFVTYTCCRRVVCNIYMLPKKKDSFLTFKYTQCIRHCADWRARVDKMYAGC